MATKLRNSDDFTNFVEDIVQEQTEEPIYGEDPFDAIARLEEEQGYPMSAKVEPSKLRKAL